jgi:hypothetical protein
MQTDQPKRTKLERQRQHKILIILRAGNRHTPHIKAAQLKYLTGKSPAKKDKTANGYIALQHSTTNP